MNAAKFMRFILSTRGPARGAGARIGTSILGRAPGLKLAAIGVAAVLVVAALLSLAVTVFLVVAPILAAIVAWQAWKIRRALKRASERSAAAGGRLPRGQAVDAEFVVIDRRSRSDRAL